MQQVSWPGTVKPGRGAVLDLTHPTCRGLAYEWTCNELAGLAVYDQAHASAAPNPAAIGNPANPAWLDGVNCTPTTYLRASPSVNTVVPGLPAAPTAAWTMECWLAATAFVPGSSLPFVFGATQGPGPTNNNASNRGFIARAGNGIGFWSGQWDWTSPASYIVDGKPHQYVFTYPGGSATLPVSLYVDGAFIASGTPSGTAGGLKLAAAANACSDVFSGGYGATGGMTGRFLRGRIWSRALPAAEVADARRSPWATYRVPWSWSVPPLDIAAVRARRSLSPRAGSRGVA